MSLQTPAELLLSEIAEDAKSYANHQENAAIILQRMAERLANAASDTLAAYLNSRGDRLTADLTEHSICSGAQNAIRASLERSIGTEILRVDDSSFVLKLAATGRAATLTAEGWIVADIPQPDPDPIDSSPQP